MMEASIAPDNPIVFVLDPSNDGITVPEYVPGEIVAHSDSCVSVGIQAAVDGETAIRLVSDAEHVAADAPCRVFKGRISTPGSGIAVVTAELQNVVETRTSHTATNIEIWVDNSEVPGLVVVVVVS